MSAPRRSATRSRRIFETLGVWEELAAGGRRHPLDPRLRCRPLRLRAPRLRSEQGIEAFGYVVANRTLGAALWKKLARVPRI